MVVWMPASCFRLIWRSLSLCCHRYPNQCRRCSSLRSIRLPGNPWWWVTLAT